MSPSLCAARTLARRDVLLLGAFGAVSPACYAKFFLHALIGGTLRWPAVLSKDVRFLACRLAAAWMHFGRGMGSFVSPRGDVCHRPVRGFARA